MSPEATLRRLIVKAERLLPGVPAAEGESDPHWQAILLIQDHIPEQPEPVWEFAVKWAKHAQEDLRTAIAVLLLEHLLEYHFELIYPRIEHEIQRSKRFLDTLRRCWWIGEAAWPANARKLDRLAGARRQRLRPRRPTTGGRNSQARQ